MTLIDTLKTLGLFFVVALVQVTIMTPLEVAHGHPDLVLVFLVSVALVRGPMLGAVAGFWAGLMLDVAAMGDIGLTSLLLTLAGYWSGRFGEATTRRSPHPPLVAVGLATVWAVVGAGFLHFMLGQGASTSDLLGQVLLPTIALNLLLAYPVYRLTCRIFPLAPRERREAALV